MLNLHHRLYQTAQLSEIDTLEVEFFLTKQLFYYKRRQDKGLDVIKFTDAQDARTIKFYRYSYHDLIKGIDIETDTPSFEGRSALEFLKNEYLI